MKINKLSINYEKTKFMLLSKKKIPTNYQIYIGPHKIEQVRKISWCDIRFPHIQQICNRLSSASWGLHKLRDYVDIPTLKGLYYCLVYPHNILHGIYYSPKSSTKNIL